MPSLAMALLSAAPTLKAISALSESWSAMGYIQQQNRQARKEKNTYSALTS
jgi:hypothetical protein